MGSGKEERERTLIKPFEDIEAFALTRECIVFPRGNFKGARFEEHDNYDITWFVWDRDGLVPESIVEDDWEPVIQFWKGEKLVMVSIRPHYRIREYFSGRKDRPNFAQPLKVVFETSSHAARLRNDQDTRFDSFLFGSLWPSRIRTRANFAIQGSKLRREAADPIKGAISISGAGY